MEHRDPRVETTAKVLKFRLLRNGRRKVVTASEVARIKEERVLLSRQQRAAAWLTEGWIVLAWIVALCQVRTALAHHRVFDSLASMAFLVAISLPVMRARRGVAVVRALFLEIRRMKQARHEARKRSADPARSPPGGSSAPLQ